MKDIYRLKSLKYLSDLEIDEMPSEAAWNWLVRGVQTSVEGTVISFSTFSTLCDGGMQIDSHSNAYDAHTHPYGPHSLLASTYL